MNLMDTAQLLGNIGKFPGSVAIVVTLVYLAVQINMARADADANAFNSNSSNQISVGAAFLQKAEIWVKANAGQSLTADEEFVFDRLTFIRVEFAFFGYRRSQALRNGREKIQVINLAMFFFEHPLAHER